MEMKYHIETNTVQETLVIPLFGRLYSRTPKPKESATRWTMTSLRSERRWNLRQGFSVHWK